MDKNDEAMKTYDEKLAEVRPVLSELVGWDEGQCSERDHQVEKRM